MYGDYVFLLEHTLFPKGVLELKLEFYKFSFMHMLKAF